MRIRTRAERVRRWTLGRFALGKACGAAKEVAKGEGGMAGMEEGKSCGRGQKKLGSIAAGLGCNGSTNTVQPIRDQNQRLSFCAAVNIPHPTQEGLDLLGR